MNTTDKGVYSILQGDCLVRLKELPSESFSCIVTDPPAGIGFMGKAWDKDKGGRSQWVAWMQEVAIECLRVLKAGGHALVWAIPKTSHWTATAWELAGFEVRDRVSHIFSEGFPKSHNIGKAFEQEGKKEEAEAWKGWGTALKPSVEDWWLLRKPLSEKNLTLNVLKHGVGGLNIDGCRVAFRSAEDKAKWKRLVSENKSALSWKNSSKKIIQNDAEGRWPAQIVHDGSDEVLSLFPRGKDGSSVAHFFYCAKVKQKERDEGLEAFEYRRAGGMTGTVEASLLTSAGNERTTTYKNDHPTVKPQALMRWLVRLVAPRGSVVLDPFMGSGSTGVACVYEGCSFLGIEQDPHYCALAVARISHAQEKVCGSAG